MQKETREPIYIVKINISYYEAVFGFNSIEEASSFMKTAALHKVKSGDTTTISMTIKEPEKEEEKEETEE